MSARYQSGDSAGAVDGLARAVALAPRSPAVVLEGVRAMLALRRYDDARDLLARARALEPEAPGVHFWAGDLASAVGDTAGVRVAVRALRAAGAARGARTSGHDAVRRCRAAAGDRGRVARLGGRGDGRRQHHVLPGEGATLPHARRGGAGARAGGLRLPAGRVTRSDPSRGFVRRSVRVAGGCLVCGGARGSPCGGVRAPAGRRGPVDPEDGPGGL